MDGGGGKKYKILPQFREKKRAAINTIYQIKNEEGEICKNSTKILSEIQKHFKDMYKKKGEAIPNVEQQLSEFMQDIQH